MFDFKRYNSNSFASLSSITFCFSNSFYKNNLKKMLLLLYWLTKILNMLWRQLTLRTRIKMEMMDRTWVVSWWTTQITVRKEQEMMLWIKYPMHGKTSTKSVFLIAISIKHSQRPHSILQEWYHWCIVMMITTPFLG